MLEILDSIFENAGIGARQKISRSRGNAAFDLSPSRQSVTLHMCIIFKFYLACLVVNVLWCLLIHPVPFIYSTIHIFMVNYTICFFKTHPLDNYRHTLKPRFSTQIGFYFSSRNFIIKLKECLLKSECQLETNQYMLVNEFR